MERLNINGQTTIDDVLAMIVDQVDSGDREGAKDSLNELRDYFEMKYYRDHKSMVEQFKRENSI